MSLHAVGSTVTIGSRRVTQCAPAAGAGSALRGTTSEKEIDVLPAASEPFPPATVRRAATVLLVAAGAAAVPAAAAQAAPTPVSVFPIPGGRVAAPSTQLTFRGVPADQLGPISVSGSNSGAHTGRIVADSDGSGASFIPSQPFKAGETVTVTTGLTIVGGNRRHLHLHGRHPGRPHSPVRRAPGAPGP